MILELKRIPEMNSEKILIVDDDTGIRQMITQIIVSHSLIFKTAKNGMEALDLIKKMDFDIIIADINDQIINGLDLMSEVHKTKPKNFYMILTGYSRDYSMKGLYKQVPRILLKNHLPLRN